MEILEKRKASLKQWGRVAGYTSLALACCVSTSEATLSDQVEKISTLTTGKIIPLALAAALTVGGGLKIKDGNVWGGAGVLGVAAVIGIGVALITSGDIFKALN